MKRTLGLSLLALALAVPASAQQWFTGVAITCPDGRTIPLHTPISSPNVTKDELCKAQGIAYKTAQFSVVFAGNSVETWSDPNKQKTSVDTFYASKTGGAFAIEQIVTFRQINGEIAVNTASLDFYVGQLTKNDGETLESKEYVHDFQGHIAVALTVVVSKELRRSRRLVIIHDSRTLFILMQSAPLSAADAKQWSDFVNSFAMNENSCWLPEGCGK